MNDMIIGSFYFQLTECGNLLGEFINHTSPRVATESAMRAEDDTSPLNEFRGIYNSTWFDGQGRNMILVIDEKQDRHRNILLNIFRLTWSEGTTVVFVGEGFLANNMLLGVYGDNVLDNHIGNLLTREN